MSQDVGPVSHTYGWPEPYIYGVYTMIFAGVPLSIRRIYTVLANSSHTTLNQSVGRKQKGVII